MDIKAHRWFQQLAQESAARVKVKLMQGSDILHELIHRKSLRDQYFPGAALETGEIRALLRKTEELTADELEAVTAENVDQYIDRLKARDARFNYEVVFSIDIRPASPRPIPGLIASVSNNKRTVNIIARDVEAINRNPPGLTLALSDEGASKIQELIRTGRAQHLSAEECLSFSSDFSFLAPPGDGKGFELRVGPAKPPGDSSLLNVRVTFGRGADAVVYDWIPFRLTRVGTAELEMVSGGNLPFTLSVVVPSDRNSTVKFNIKYDPAGADVRAVKKFVTAMDLLGSPTDIEFFDLRQGKPLFNVNGNGEEKIDFDPTFRRLVEDLSMIADYYGVDFTVPRFLTPADRQTLRLLVDLARGTNYEVDDISMTLTKNADLSPEVRDALRRPGRFLVTQQAMDPSPVLFGVTVPTGLISCQIDCATVRHPEEFEARLATAAIGDPIDVSLVPCGPVNSKAIGRSSGR